MRSEALCRYLFQYFTEQTFDKCRPKFLGGLELDGYCRKHEIAFEYNGIQHYRYTPYFHDSFCAFERQQERDQRKQDLCQRYGLVLMTVPYTYTPRNGTAMSYFVHGQLLRTERLRSQVYMVNRSPLGFFDDLLRR